MEGVFLVDDDIVTIYPFPPLNSAEEEEPYSPFLSHRDSGKYHDDLTLISVLKIWEWLVNGRLIPVERYPARV